MLTSSSGYPLTYLDKLAKHVCWAFATADNSDDGIDKGSIRDMVSPEYTRSRREVLTFINYCSPVYDFGNKSVTASGVSISVSQDGGGKMKSRHFVGGQRQRHEP